jgi:hypothetical protein
MQLASTPTDQALALASLIRPTRLPASGAFFMAPEPAVAPSLRLVDSITELGPADADCIAVSGSHGGSSAAQYALAVRPRLTVFNDAGVGKDCAGIAALDLMQAAGLAAVTVSHASACIGQAHSTLQTGVISHANVMAQALGCAPGMTVRICAQRLGVAPSSAPPAP